jgi:PadR family transcriptional regulator, regulatory protein PadR
MVAEVLSTLDLLVMLAVLRLDGQAYGVPIADAVGAARGRPVSMAAVYTALERLEERGLIVSEVGAPTAERGGRAKRFMHVTPQGLSAVKATRRALTKMWTDVPALKDRLT